MASNEIIDYKKYLALVKRDKMLCILSALVVMTVVTVTSYVLPKKYEANSTVFIEKSVIAELVKGLAVTSSVDDKIKVLTYALNSRTLIMKVIEELDMKKGNDAGLEKLIKTLQDDTQIKIKDREGLFLITHRNSNPKLARDYVNTIVRRYIEETVSSQRRESYGATTFISEQLLAIRDRQVKSEEAANNFKRGPGAIASMDPISLRGDINATQQRLDDLKIRQTQLESQLDGLKASISPNSNLPLLQKKLQEMQLQFTDNYPDIIQLKDLIRELEEQIKSGHTPVVRPTVSPDYDRAASELKALRQNEANLRAKIAKNESLLQSIPAAKTTLEELERDKLALKNQYEQMAARQGQSEVSKQMEVQDKSTIFRIVDPAVLPAKPVIPNRKKIILLGILAGIGAGIGLVILKDTMDASVKDVDVARQFGIPILAVIPRIEQPDEIALRAKQDRKLYIASLSYFSVILAILAWEYLSSIVL